MQELRERRVGFRSHESIDTTTSGGRLIFGRHGGCPPVLDEKRRWSTATAAVD